MPEQGQGVEAQVEIGAIGRSQASSLSALVEDEYLSELRWPKNIKAYDKMRRSDSQVQAILLVMELPIRSTQWFVEPYSEDQQDVDIAEFISGNLFSGPPQGLSQHWDDFLRLALTMLPFGHSVFEKVFDVDEDGLFTWKKFAHRPQRTIHDFMYDDEGGPDGIKQVKYERVSYDVVEIPIEKLLIFSNRMESGDLRGQSILRSAYKHWKIKDFLYQMLNIGVERNLVGTPTMELPEGAKGEEKKRAKQIVEDLRSSECGGVTIPHGFILDLFEGKRGMMEVLPYIEHHDKSMARSVLAQFMNLGDGSTGTYALSKDQSELFLMMLNATADYIRDTINSYAIPQLVDLNWEVEGYPQLQYKPIAKDEELMGTLNNLVLRNIVAPDDDLEAWVRDMLGLPEKAEEENDTETYSWNESRSQDEDHIHGGECVCGGTLLERYEARTFDEDGNRTWRRDLTAWERNVNLEEIEDAWDSAEEEFIEKGGEISQKQIRELFKRMKKHVEDGELDELAKIPVRYRGEFTDFLRKQNRELLDFGKEQAARELGIDEEDVPTPNEKRRAANARAGVVADNIAQRIKTDMMLECIARLEAGDTAKAALYGAREAAEERAERELDGSASVQVGEAINDGRDLASEEAGVELAQYSGILDDRICLLCEHLDGMIIEVNNPDYDRFTPRIHQRCRCLWVYIDPEEEPQPEPDWETPPDSLVEDYGSLVSQ